MQDAIAIRVLDVSPWSVVLVLAAAAFVLNGCGRTPTLDAPQVRWGQDTCAACGMILSDDRYAGAVVMIRDGERHVALFDDIGEMLATLRDTSAQPAEPQRLWVTDAETREWIDAASARFLHSDSLQTPMGFGVAAFAHADAARSAQEQWGGQVTTLTQLGRGSSSADCRHHDTIDGTDTQTKP